MHWRAHREWYYNRRLLEEALEVARTLDVPVLFHTGEFKECHAGVFLDVCRGHDDLTFVLAHGCPIDETMEVLAQCSNAYVDTAFMPVGNAVSLVQNGFTQRMLFGTDAPINLLFYKDMTTTEYIQRCWTSLQRELPLETYTNILSNTVYHSWKYLQS